ncbi:Digalactosyldiacylglycerol synthase [Musa troglodytarum]|uniref:Digalactosyldiacylglycerol synthase n=1 Tax=Musa troglodytarum TaxID=320322 RepID=A0A9E7EUA8_9LILI|nr:Digalactosyldiacylglycerol synthase [Musa troglodytarum]
MLNLGAERPPPQLATGTAEKALSFLSKGWREVRDSADADLQLMRQRANSFKNLADRELEHFLNSAAIPPSGAALPSPSIAEFELVKRIQPKLSAIRRAYSSPEFGRRVLEKWSPKATIRIDLSAIKNAIVSEVDEVGAALDLSWDEDQTKENSRWEEGRGGIIEQGKGWEPIRILKTRLKEFERKSQSTEIFGTFKSSEFIEKVKLSLQSICKETEESMSKIFIFLILDSGLYMASLTMHVYHLMLLTYGLVQT